MWLRREVKQGARVDGRQDGIGEHMAVARDHITLPSTVMRDLENDPSHGRGSSPLVRQPDFVMFMVAGRLAVGSGRPERGLDVGGATTTSATGAANH